MCANFKLKRKDKEICIIKKTIYVSVLKLEVYLHAFQTSAQDRSDVISSNKYLRNLKPFITEIVRQ